MKLAALYLTGLLAVSCSTGLQTSKTSSWDDEIYAGNNAKATAAENQVVEKSPTPSTKNQQYSKLDEKYTEALKALNDSSNVDTVIYKSQETNPYRRILSDSYQESYERRLRGFEDPRYGIEDWSIYYSDDYRYAQAYDPSYYRIVVMGSNVWVEPWYIYNSFGWPRSRFYFGFGYGFDGGYNPWYVGYYWNPWYYNSMYYSSWYYNPYFYANSPYWWGWNDATYYWNRYTPNSNYYYGRRSTTGGYNTDQHIGSRETAISKDGQVVKTRRTRTTDVATSENNPVVTTRSTQTRVAPSYETRRGDGSSNNNEQVLIRRERTTSGTRTTNESTFNETGRTNRPTREIGISEPIRRTSGTTYEWPRTSGNSDYNYSRRVERPGNTNSTISRNPSPTPHTRSTAPTYNRPNRVSTPSSSGSPSSNTYRSRETGGSNHSYGSGNSNSRASSSSTSSFSNGSRSSSNSSSSSTGSRKR